jgi:hypothetical protein
MKSKSIPFRLDHCGHANGSESVFLSQFQVSLPLPKAEQTLKSHFAANESDSGLEDLSLGFGIT